MEGLSSHVADVDILLSSYNPYICIHTSVGAAIKKRKRMSFLFRITYPFHKKELTRAEE